MYQEKGGNVELERSAKIEKLNSKLEAYKEDLKYFLGEHVDFNLPFSVIKEKNFGKQEVLSSRKIEGNKITEELSVVDLGMLVDE